MTPQASSGASAVTGLPLSGLVGTGLATRSSGWGQAGRCPWKVSPAKRGRLALSSLPPDTLQWTRPRTVELPGYFKNASSRSLPSSQFVVVCLNLRLPEPGRCFQPARLPDIGAVSTPLCEEGSTQDSPANGQAPRHASGAVGHQACEVPGRPSSRDYRPSFFLVTQPSPRSPGTSHPVLPAGHWGLPGITQPRWKPRAKSLVTPCMTVLKGQRCLCFL